MFNSFFFFFSSRRRHTRLQGDWSSDVCSSDLLVGRQRAGASPAGIDLSLPHPGAQRCLGEIELPGDRPEALLAPLHQPDRLRLELRRERSPLPPPLLSHDTLLSHFRASWGVHETGASSRSTHRTEYCST